MYRIGSSFLFVCEGLANVWVWVRRCLASWKMSTLYPFQPVYLSTFGKLRIRNEILRYHFLKNQKGGTNTFLSTNMRLLYYKLTKIWAFWYMLIKTIFYNCGLKRMKSLTHFTHLRGVMADWKVQWDLIWIDPAPESWIKVVGMLHILYVLIIDLFVTVLGG